jgi:hypothetical protein
MSQRVQIPAYTDRWMMGDRYGEVVKTYWSNVYLTDLARVKLDISGKVVTVKLKDCTKYD